MTIQAELTNLRAKRDRLRREIAEKNEQLGDQHQLQKELAQTRAQLQRRDQELAQANTTLERARKRARVEENQLAVFEEDTPITPIHSQAPTMHAPPPHVSPTSVPPAHRGASPTHLPPPVSSGPHPAYSGGQSSFAADDRARIVVLESTVNQLAATMATNMAELMALLKGPNRASSSFTPPPGYGPAVDPSPWASRP
ncbi:hypothetical protein CDL15_Pgr026473 [Punica granatum]|uniref:Uncharacterized protein n=1 Tax=Punica granatum TaxID=22663 RepID=A0A218VSI1_PUNGR|nr:hypothetical protein CDL15_Pgr026473 [Punica granatum]